MGNRVPLGERKLDCTLLTKEPQNYISHFVWYGVTMFKTQQLKVIRLQRSGIDTIKYHTRPRIPMGKWQTYRRHHKREPRGQPFPSRWPQSTYKQTRTKHSKHKTEQKHKRSTKEVPPYKRYKHNICSFQKVHKHSLIQNELVSTFTLKNIKLHVY